MTTQTEALKLALEALEELFNTNGYWWQEVDEQTLKKIEHSITAIKEALAQQCVCGEPNSAGTHRTDGPCLAPQPEQEPVACKTLCELCVKRGYTFCANAAKTTPIPTPPKRTWVWITPEDEKEIKENCTTVACVLKAVKAKLKEKNT